MDHPTNEWGLDTIMATKSTKPLRPITTLWKLRDGGRIRVCDMDDAHLLNTIRFLARQMTSRVGTLPQGVYTPDSPEYREALAQWEAVMRSGVADLEPYYHDMMEEMGRRGLSLDTRTLFRDAGRLIIDFSAGTKK